MSPRSLGAAFLLLAIATAPARGEDAAIDPVLRQEVLGGEIAPLSINRGTPPDTEPPARVQFGVGLKLRLFRHRWLRGAYWTPIQGGGFLGRGDDRGGAIFMNVQTEGGGIFRFEGHTFEVGIAAGAGVLAIQYSRGGEGRRVIGGVGWMLSPVVRYLFREAGSHTLGLVFRAEIPLSVPPTNYDWLGHWTARADLFLIAFDAGFGWG